jgi:aminoglycoside phosphotransferase (APT) family kinase protein
LDSCEEFKKPTSNPGAQTKMHAGELDINAALIRRLLAGQFPQLADHSLRVVRSMGTVNAIFRLGDDLCVRLPRVERWAEGIMKEWEWLPKLAPQLSLSIPKPLYLGVPAEGYPCPWAVYEWLDGEPYQDKLVYDESQMARDLARFIKELRGVETHGAPRAGRRPLRELKELTSSAIAAKRGLIDRDAVSAAWSCALETPVWDGEPVWIHTDLLKSNLLMRDGRLYGVLDFGSAGIGDPAFDVVPAWSVFTAEGRRVFREALDVDEATWFRAQGYALHQALLIIPYYVESNPGFMAMAQRTVGEVLGDG